MINIYLCQLHMSKIERTEFRNSGSMCIHKCFYIPRAGKVSFGIRIDSARSWINQLLNQESISTTLA